MKGIDFCFDKLYETLSPKSYYYNDIIHLKMRYSRVENETNMNLISFSEKNLELDRIQVALWRCCMNKKPISKTVARQAKQSFSV